MPRQWWRCPVWRRLTTPPIRPTDCPMTTRRRRRRRTTPPPPLRATPAGWRRRAIAGGRYDGLWTGTPILRHCQTTRKKCFIRVRCSSHASFLFLIIIILFSAASPPELKDSIRWIMHSISSRGWSEGNK